MRTVIASRQMLARTMAAAVVLAGLTSPPAQCQSAAEITAAVNAAYGKYKGLKEGKNADYIPALAKVDPNLFGIAVVTADGKVYTAGDVTTEVSIQSISKVFTMALVMRQQGPDAILKTIGVDATGMRFNSIVSVEMSYKLGGGPEMNPLVNPGAITATSMVQGRNYKEIWGSILSTYGEYAGRPLKVLEDVYKSESATNQRNQAIGMLMYAYGYIKADPDQATDIYTRQCSVGVNATDLATMAATLAFGGTNPVTKKPVIKGEYVPEDPGSHGHGRFVRRFRQVALRHRAPRQERGRGRDHRRLAREVRHRGDLAAAGRRGQQCPGAAGHRGHFQRAGREPVRPGWPDPVAGGLGRPCRIIDVLPRSPALCSASSLRWWPPAPQGPRVRRAPAPGTATPTFI